MKDLDTNAIRADRGPLRAPDAETIGVLCEALDEARTVRRRLRSRLAAVAALPRFPDDDDPAVLYVLAADVDAALRGDL